MAKGELKLRNPQKVADEVVRSKEELKTKLKPKEELVVSVEGLVREVIGYNKSTSTIIGEPIIGGRNRTRGTGYKSDLEIKIDGDSPVKTLYFKGWPPIEKGDTIRAYISKGRELNEMEEALLDDYKLVAYANYFTTRKINFLVERDFQEKETAVKIEKLRGEEVIATYIDANFYRKE